MKTNIFCLSVFAALLFIFSCSDSETTKNQNNILNERDSIVEITQNNTNLNDNSIKTTENEVIDQKSLTLSNEKIVFSFETNKGKTMSLAMDKNQKYIVYRFGQAGKVELQYPEEFSGTFEKFTYNYYMRGGGAANAGLDLNYVSFTGDTHKIIIYEEYSSGDPENPEESTSVGLRIIDLKTNKETKILGLEKTMQGSLIDFRDNGLISVVEGEI